MFLVLVMVLITVLVMIFMLVMIFIMENGPSWDVIVTELRIFVSKTKV